MSSSTTELINRLAGERSQLYTAASRDSRSAASISDRIVQIDRELEALWNHKRREKAGTRQGIDLVVHQAYERAYGRDYEDILRPRKVALPEDGEAESVA